MLFDLGPSGETLENAKRLRIDPEKVDAVILSHGHYDHSGGILPFSLIREEELDEVYVIARELKTYPTRFVTCHCTGLAPVFQLSV